MDSAKAELSAAQAKQKEAENALTTAKNGVSTAETDLANAKKAAAAKEQAATDAQGALDTAKKKQTEAETNLANAKSDNASAIAAKQKADDAVTAAQADKAVADAAVKQAESDKSAADAAVAAAQAEVDRINTAIDAANEQAKQGSLGFINWMLEQENLTEQQKADLDKAKQVIESAQAENFNRWADGDKVTCMPAERNNMVTVIGDEKDATSLANLKKSITIMKKINELRASDDNFVGSMKRNASFTNFYFMAVAQTGADRGAGLLRHSHLEVSCENLAFGYYDPTAGWYTKEKRFFDQIKSDLGITEINNSTLSQIKKEASNRKQEIGHYTNLLWAADQLMGVGFTQYNTTSCYNASDLGNYRTKYTNLASYTVDEFEALLSTYQAYLDNPGSGLSAAQAALTQAQGKQSAAAATVTTKKQAANTAQQKVAQTQAKQTEAQNAVTASERAITKKQNELKSAQDAVAQAETALGEATKQVGLANDSVTAKQQALGTAKGKASTAEANLATAKSNTATAQGKVNDANAELAGLSEELASAQEDYDKAVAAQQEAIATQGEAASDLATAEREAKAAAEVLEQAEGAAGAKQIAANNAGQSATDANKELSSAQGELNRLNGLVSAADQAQSAVNSAAADVSNAKTQLDAANAAIPTAEATVVQRQQESAALADTLAAVKAVNADDAYETGIADARFSRLDSLYAAARQAQTKVDAAKQQLESAEAEVGRHSQRYVEALLNYQEASENLRAAQAAYDDALAKEAAEAEAAQAKYNGNNANSVAAPAKLPSANTQQVNGSSPKTGDNAVAGALAALAGAGAGATLLANCKLRRAKHLK